jgi:hypothetical protein
MWVFEKFGLTDPALKDLARLALWLLVEELGGGIDKAGIIAVHAILVLTLSVMAIQQHERIGACYFRGCSQIPGREFFGPRRGWDDAYDQVFPGEHSSNDGSGTGRDLSLSLSRGG